MTSPDPARPSGARHWHRAGQAGCSSPRLGTALLCPSQGPPGPGPQGAPHHSPSNPTGLWTWCLFSAALKRASLWYIMAPQDPLAFILSSPTLILEDTPTSPRGYPVKTARSAGRGRVNRGLATTQCTCDHFLTITLSKPHLHLYLFPFVTLHGEIWGQALPFSTFMSNIPDSSSSI